MCQSRMPSGTTNHEVKLKIYSQAYKGFDLEGIDEYKEGHRLLYNPEAAKDSIEQARSFLEKYFK
jgi:dienelactone hydrolase